MKITTPPAASDLQAWIILKLLSLFYTKWKSSYLNLLIKLSQKYLLNYDCDLSTSILIIVEAQDHVIFMCKS